MTLTSLAPPDVVKKWRRRTEFRPTVRLIDTESPRQRVTRQQLRLNDARGEFEVSAGTVEPDPAASASQN